MKAKVKILFLILMLLIFINNLVAASVSHETVLDNRHWTFSNINICEDTKTKDFKDSLLGFGFSARKYSNNIIRMQNGTEYAAVMYITSLTEDPFLHMQLILFDIDNQFSTSDLFEKSPSMYYEINNLPGVYDKWELGNDNILSKYTNETLNGDFMRLVFGQAKLMCFTNYQGIRFHVGDGDYWNRPYRFYFDINTLQEDLEWRLEEAGLDITDVLDTSTLYKEYNSYWKRNYLINNKGVAGNWTRELWQTPFLEEGKK